MAENRLAKPVSEVEIKAKIGNAVPKSTKYKEKWAVKLFESWREQKNVKLSNSTKRSSCGLKIIHNCLEVISDEELNRTLALFVCGIRKTDGNKYPPNTIHGIAASTEHFLKLKRKPVKLFIDDKFAHLRDVLDTTMKESASSGLEMARKQGVVTLEEEEILRTKRALGDSNPQQLLNSLVYLFDIYFALIGGSEYQKLRAQNSQIFKGKDKRNGLQFLEYREDVSKTNAGGLKGRKQ